MKASYTKDNRMVGRLGVDATWTRHGKPLVVFLPPRLDMLEFVRCR